MCVYTLIGLCSVSLLIMILIYRQLWPRVTVYRYSKKDCIWCIVSESEWKTFKNNLKFKNVKCVDAVLDEDKDAIESFSNQGLRGVPTVVAVFDDGRRFVANGPQIKRLYANVIGSL